MVSRKLEVNVPLKILWDVVIDIEKYPEFQKELKKIEVRKSEGGKKLIYHEIEIIKPVWYILEYDGSELYKKFSWKLIECSSVKLPLIKEFKVMEKNEGFWDFVDEGPDKCSATYNLDIKFASKIPSNITEMLANKRLPSMMESFKKRAEDLLKSK